MKSDLPCSVAVEHGDVHVTLPFADNCDAVAFVNSQARAADQMGHKQFAATLTRSDGVILANISAAGHDISGAVVDAMGGDDQGFTRMRVAGIDALVYAHRSCESADVLVVGVDADEGQRILFAVNDGDLVDTVVGERTGTLDVAYSPTVPLVVTCAVTADSPAAARQILESAACCQPLHFTS